MSRNNSKLRIERSANYSGVILNENKITVLKESNYFVIDKFLDGDAPKQFISAYFYEEESGVRKNNNKTWYEYIAKSAEKWYPHESVIEYMMNQIGDKMGLRMNETKLAKVNGQIRFLSKYFLNKNEKLIHGAEICGEHLGDYSFAEEIAKHKPSARELFTFQFIEESIRSVFPIAYPSILKDLVSMLAFDALVGNNDRHFYNWGVIDTKKRTKKIPTFAPIYDSARGLLWNFNDENIIKHKKIVNEGGKKFENYIDDAKPRISVEGDSDINHFELINFLINYNKEYRDIVKELSDEDIQRKILNMLEKDFYKFFLHERNELIAYLIKRRFETIRMLLK